MSKRFVAVHEIAGIVLPTKYRYRYFDSSRAACGLIDRATARRKNAGKSAIGERRYVVDRKLEPHVILPGAAPYSGR